MSGFKCWRVFSRQLLSFNGTYHKLFQRRTISLSGGAFQRLKGLFQADKKNIADGGNWDWRPVNEQVARDCDKMLGGYDDIALYIDDTGIPKKGDKSIGVGRQWCGQLGKVDNCQGAVFAALGRGHFSTLIDFRLYLPKEWIKDKKRSREAKIPKD